MPSASSRSWSACAHWRTISMVLSGWNCTPRCRPCAKACTPAFERASSSAPGGSVKASKCHCNHGPAGTTAGSALCTAYQPSSGVGARSIVPPSTLASTWPPKHRPSTGMSRRTASAMNATSAATSTTCSSSGLFGEPSEATNACPFGAGSCAPLCAWWISSEMPRAAAQSPRMAGGPRSPCCRMSAVAVTPQPCRGRPATSRGAPPDHALGLVLRDGERDVQGLRGRYELLAQAGQVDVPIHDGVLEAAKAADLHRDLVAGLHRPRVGRRAGQHDIARLERDQPAQVRQLIGHAPDQIAGGALLDHLAVEVGLEREVGGIELRRRHDLRADRQEAVLALDAQHRTPVSVTEVVEADIVGRRVAGDVAEHVVNADSLHPPPNHDGQLALVVEEPRAAGPPDHPSVAVERVRRLQEVGGRRRRVGLVLVDPAAVGQVDGDDLRRLHWGQVRRLRPRDLAAIPQDDVVAVATTPRRGAVDRYPNSPHVGHDAPW